MEQGQHHAGPLVPVQTKMLRQCNALHHAVVMTQDRPLGARCRPRRIDDLRGILPGHRTRAPVRIPGFIQRGQQFKTLFCRSRPRQYSDADRGTVRRDRTENGQKHWLGYQPHTGGVLQQIGQFVGRIVQVDRHHDRTDLIDREPRLQEFGAVGQHHGNGLSGLNAQCHQMVGQPVHLATQPAICQFRDAARFVLVHQKNLVGVLFDLQPQQ